MIGFRGNALLAIPLASASGDITDSDVIAWSLDRAGRCWWDDGVFTAERRVTLRMTARVRSRNDR